MKLKDRFLAGAAGFALVASGLITAAPASASEDVTPPALLRRVNLSR